MITQWVRFAYHNENLSKYSYVIDGGDKRQITEIHHSRWKAREANRMLPILIPNIGFKEFSEIKPKKLEAWLKSIEADLDSLETICGDNKSTYTGKEVTIPNINMVFKSCLGERFDLCPRLSVKLKTLMRKPRKFSTKFFKWRYFLSTGSQVSAQYLAIWCGFNHSTQKNSDQIFSSRFNTDYAVFEYENQSLCSFTFIIK